jgi:hypothetical protein
VRLGATVDAVDRRSLWTDGSNAIRWDNVPLQSPLVLVSSSDMVGGLNGRLSRRELIRPL